MDCGITGRAVLGGSLLSPVFLGSGVGAGIGRASAGRSTSLGASRGAETGAKGGSREGRAGLSKVVAGGSRRAVKTAGARRCAWETGRITAGDSGAGADGVKASALPNLKAPRNVSGSSRWSGANSLPAERVSQRFFVMRFEAGAEPPAGARLAFLAPLAQPRRIERAVHFHAAKAQPRTAEQRILLPQNSVLQRIGHALLVAIARVEDKLRGVFERGHAFKTISEGGPGIRAVPLEIAVLVIGPDTARGGAQRPVGAVPIAPARLFKRGAEKRAQRGFIASGLCWHVRAGRDRAAPRAHVVVDRAVGALEVEVEARIAAIKEREMQAEGEARRGIGVFHALAGGEGKLRAGKEAGEIAFLVAGEGDLRSEKKQVRRGIEGEAGLEISVSIDAVEDGGDEFLRAGRAHRGFRRKAEDGEGRRVGHIEREAGERDRLVAERGGGEFARRAVGDKVRGRVGDGLEAELERRGGQRERGGRREKRLQCGVGGRALEGEFDAPGGLAEHGFRAGGRGKRPDGESVALAAGGGARADKPRLIFNRNLDDETALAMVARQLREIALVGDDRFRRGHLRERRGRRAPCGPARGEDARPRVHAARNFTKSAMTFTASSDPL